MGLTVPSRATCSGAAVGVSRAGHFPFKKCCRFTRSNTVQQRKRDWKKNKLKKLLSLFGTILVSLCFCVVKLNKTDYILSAVTGNFRKQKCD